MHAASIIREAASTPETSVDFYDTIRPYDHLFARRRGQTLALPSLVVADSVNDVCRMLLRFIFAWQVKKFRGQAEDREYTTLCVSVERDLSLLSV
jgi:hypothetical protein